MTDFKRFQVVLAGFRWFQVVPRFSKYVYIIDNNMKKK